MRERIHGRPLLEVERDRNSDLHWALNAARLERDEARHQLGNALAWATIASAFACIFGLLLLLRAA